MADLGLARSVVVMIVVVIAAGEIFGPPCTNYIAAILQRVAKGPAPGKFAGTEFV